MHDDDLGLTDREKELRKWNAPYQYREYPRMLFRGRQTVGGRLEVEQRVVGSEGELATATASGWVLHPTRAIDEEERRQAAPGVAAAERAYTDRQLSLAAQAEAAAADAATSRHLPELPARPVSRRSARSAPPARKAHMASTPTPSTPTPKPPARPGTPTPTPPIADRPGRPDRIPTPTPPMVEPDPPAVEPRRPR